MYVCNYGFQTTAITTGKISSLTRVPAVVSFQSHGRILHRRVRHRQSSRTKVLFPLSLFFWSDSTSIDSIYSHSIIHHLSYYMYNIYIYNTLNSPYIPIAFLCRFLSPFVPWTSDGEAASWRHPDDLWSVPHPQMESDNQLGDTGEGPIIMGKIEKEMI